MLRVLLAANPSPMTVDGTRTFVVGTRRPVVVDPGPAEPGHQAALLQALGGAVPAAILLTHAHPDHAEAAPRLAARTGAPLRILPGALEGTPADAVPLAPGERIESDAGSLLVVPTPGHAPEHAVFLWRGGPPEHEGALFAGDMFVGGADTTLVAPPEGDLTEYLASLDRIEALSPTTLHPAHGPPIPDAPAAVARYRAHRGARIDQVLALLREGGEADPQALVDRVYGPALDPALRGAAAASLRAILAHLRSVGEVVPAEGGRYRTAHADRR